MSQLIEFQLEGRKIRERTLDEFFLLNPQEGVFYWCDLSDSQDERNGLLFKKLGIEEPLLEELRTDDLTPHLEEKEESLLFFLPALLKMGQGEEEPQVRRCLVYLAPHFLVTLAPEGFPALEAVRKNYRKEFLHAASAGFLLFLLFDEKISEWAALLSQFEAKVDRIEEGIQESKDGEVGAQIFRLKKKLLFAKKFLSAERDILMKISGKKISVITEKGRLSLGDLYQHTQNLVNSLDMLREILSLSLDSYMSVLSQRLNQVMKVLTTFATIVLPMSLVPAIFGMNFEVIPGSHWRHGFWASLAIMAGVGGILAFYFKRRRWL